MTSTTLFCPPAQEADKEDHLSGGTERRKPEGRPDPARCPSTPLREQRPGCAQIYFLDTDSAFDIF
jgi:hypothetical protein